MLKIYLKTNTFFLVYIFDFNIFVFCLRLMTLQKKKIFKKYCKKLESFKKDLEALEFDLRLYAIRSGIQKINIRNVCPVCGTK